MCLKPPLKHTSISLVSRGLSSRYMAKPPITAYWIEFCSRSLVIRSVADVMFATGGTGCSPSSSSESGSNSILYVSALIGFAPAIVLEYGAKSLSLAGILPRKTSGASFRILKCRRCTTISGGELVTRTLYYAATYSSKASLGRVQFGNAGCRG